MMYTVTICNTASLIAIQDPRDPRMESGQRHVETVDAPSAETAVFAVWNSLVTHSKEWQSSAPVVQIRAESDWAEEYHYWNAEQIPGLLKKAVGQMEWLDPINP